MAKRRPLRIEDLFQLKLVGRAMLAPDGRRVVFELKRLDERENKNYCQLMLADVSTGNVRPLTDGPHADTGPRFSPDGTRLAFISTREKVAAIYVLPLDGGEPRRLTDRDGSISDFAWSPDGRRIAYAYQPLSDRELLERDGRHDELRKRPQYKHITRLRHKLDGAGWWNGHYKHIWITRADGEGRPKQLTRGNYDDTEPRFSPDGRLVSFVSNRVADPDNDVENADIYVVPAGGGRAAPRKLTHVHGWCAGHAWSPDGRWIAFIGDLAKPGEGWMHLKQICLIPASGAVPRVLARQIDNHCSNLTLGDTAGLPFEGVPPVWSADSRRVTFLVSDAGAVHVYTQAIDDTSAHPLVRGDVNVYWLHGTSSYPSIRTRNGPPPRDADDAAAAEIIFCAGTQTNPGDVYTLDQPTIDAGAGAVTPAPSPARRAITGSGLVAASGASPAGAGLAGGTRRVSDVNAAALSRVELTTPEPFTVRSGAATVAGWVMKPVGFRAGRRYPAILQIHGGPHTQYGHAMFHEMQFLAARGYVVCFANPRGSAGYGIEYQRCIHCDWGNLDYKDVMRVADWLCTRRFVDPRRVGVTGGSYGGYMTSWLIGHTDRFKAAVTQRGLNTFDSMFGTSDYGWEFRKDFGDMPWTALPRSRRQSPLSHLRNVTTPLLIEHQEEDHRCPIEQADQLFTLLKGLGKTVEYIRYEGESHGMSRTGRPQNRAERLRRIVAWFDRYL